MRNYFEPEFEIVRFSVEDVLASSTSSAQPSTQRITDEYGDEWTPWVRPTRPNQP